MVIAWALEAMLPPIAKIARPGRIQASVAAVVMVVP